MTIRYICNGEKIGAYDFADSKTPDATTQFDIGRVSNRYFPGEIDEIRVWNDAENCDDEIKDNL